MVATTAETDQTAEEDQAVEEDQAAVVGSPVLPGRAVGVTAAARVEVTSEKQANPECT